MQGNFISKDYIFRGRKFSSEDIKMIRDEIEKHPHYSKTKISKLICEILNWRQINGSLKVMALREAMARMEKIGLLKLPARRKSGGYYRNIIWKTKTELAISEKEINEIDFGNVDLKMVRWTEQEKLWNYLIDTYHYLGFCTPVGRYVKYIIYSKEDILGCIGFSDGVLKLNLRDKWLGWDIEQREKNLHLVINNNRFLILPFVRVQNLASKILSIAVREVVKDWESIYKYRPVLVETFVDVSKFTGTCYRASNWIYLGRTIGKGRRGMKYFIHNQPKDVFVYPLCKDYLKVLKCCKL